MDTPAIAGPEPFKRCEWCENAMTGTAAKRFCSDKCRAASWQDQRFERARKLIEEALRLLGPSRRK